MILGIVDDVLGLNDERVFSGDSGDQSFVSGGDLVEVVVFVNEGLLLIGEVFSGDFEVVLSNFELLAQAGDIVLSLRDQNIRE